uniref:Uncharacterized protein n=2 Tax=Enterococcus TaxID=1350 RepID=A0A286KC69_ENTAV|nr:hypothetical protein pEMA120_p68 [Enterococcus faecium]APB62512.1 hypothetical protein pEA19081_p16 [Enterococcus avium]
MGSQERGAHTRNEADIRKVLVYNLYLSGNRIIVWKED